MPQSTSTLGQLWAGVLDRSLLLLAGAIAGLIGANVNLPAYQLVAGPLHFAVNDVAMAFFFALAAKEVVEATAPGGALHSRRVASMPILAAVGGMAAPAVIYVSLAIASGHPELMPGWAIPCATDIAFSCLAARRILGDRHPAIPFLLLLAIADDALGLAILAVFYPSAPLRLAEFVVLAGSAMAIAAWLRRTRQRNFWPYILVAGTVSWVGFYRGGLHPALALVPIVPFVPHASRDPGLFVPGNLHDPLSEFERWWRTPVQLILFFFGFVNAGVPVVSVGAGTWIVLAAIIIGKPIGILAATGAGVLGGLRKPAGVSWTDLLVAGTVAGIGFTVALFFATAALPPGPLLDETKMGALLSFVAAPLAALLWLATRSRRHS